MSQQNMDFYDYEYHFFLGIFAPDSLALLKAIATACFWFLPCSISVFMFLEIVFLLLPDFKGIYDLYVNINIVDLHNFLQDPFQEP
jgi:hypothetical protein